MIKKCVSKGNLLQQHFLFITSTILFCHVTAQSFQFDDKFKHKKVNIKKLTTFLSLKFAQILQFFSLKYFGNNAKGNSSSTGSFSLVEIIKLTFIKTILVPANGGGVTNTRIAQDYFLLIQLFFSEMLTLQIHKCNWQRLNIYSAKTKNAAQCQ